MKPMFSIALAFALLGSIGSAQATVWKQDNAHSQVKFAVTHMVISEVTGDFKNFDVTLTQGKDDFSGSTLEATLKTASINTENEMRDKHLRSDDFLNAEKYPTISFKSTSLLDGRSGPHSSLILPASTMRLSNGEARNLSPYALARVSSSLRQWASPISSAMASGPLFMPSPQTSQAR